VCCSVLQCVAMCCNMLQCVAMCCSGNVSCVVLMSHIVFVHLICHAHRGVVSRARKHPVFAQQNILRIIMHRPCRARELVTYYAQTHLVCAHACIEGMREMCAFAEHRYIHTFIECMSIHSMNVWAKSLWMYEQRAHAFMECMSIHCMNVWAKSTLFAYTFITCMLASCACSSSVCWYIHQISLGMLASCLGSYIRRMSNTQYHSIIHLYIVIQTHNLIHTFIYS